MAKCKVKHESGGPRYTRDDGAICFKIEREQSCMLNAGHSTPCEFGAFVAVNPPREAVLKKAK